MKLPNPQLVQKQDVPGAPGWLGKVLGSVNGAIDSLVKILQKQVSIRDNLNAEVLELKLEDGVETTILLPTLVGLPRHARVTYTAAAAYASMYWRPGGASNRDIVVSVSWDPPQTEPVLTRIVVEGE